MSSIIFIILFVLAIVVLGTAAWGGVSAATWVPMWSRDLKRVLDLADFEGNDVLYDLGCGDGRILAYAAQNYNIKKAVGYEASITPYLFAKLRATFSKGHKKIFVKYGNLYKADLSQADVVVCFLMPKAMKKLKSKFEKELKSGARVISYAFEVPGWEPKRVSKIDKEISVFAYQK